MYLHNAVQIYNNQKKLGYNTIFSLVYMEIIKNFLVLIVVVVDSWHVDTEFNDWYTVIIITYLYKTKK